MQSLLILGRQPALGLAELESVLSANILQPIGTNAVTADVPANEIPFNRLGGCIKLTKILVELPYTDFNKLVSYVSKTLPEHLDYLPEGKMKFGMSVYGIRTDVGAINRATLQVKKVIKASGRSVRVIPNKEQALNSAQVLYNQLTSPLGMELIFVRNGNKTILAQTVAEQDIDAYAARDQERPKRDSKVGMLPPKLAQTIINLAKPSDNDTILDPFCGTGVVLQEALLMGYNTFGSDLEPRMVEYSQQNLDWLYTKIDVKGKFSLEVGDATHKTWSNINCIAGETYLGRPFSVQPDPNVLQEVMQDVNLIHKRFLQNVVRQTEAGFRMCIAIPAWITKDGFKHLKLLDSLEDLGYTRIKFVHTDWEDLIYHREGQIVARELVVLTRN